MAESRMMTPADVVAQVMGGEHGDVLREAVALVARALMEAEISAQVGAEHGERSPDRVAHRNGYRPRAWKTRVGEIELLIPKARSGPAYFPSFVEPRRTPNAPRSWPNCTASGSPTAPGAGLGNAA